MLDQETITQQQALLAAHRRTLAVLLQQQALLGGIVYSTPGIINGITEAQSAIRRIKEQLRANGVPVEDEPNDDVRLGAMGSTSRLTPEDQRNRSRMLDKVEAFWVKGVLEKSLYQIARIELGLEYDPNSVTHPWKSVVQRPKQPDETIPAGKRLIEVFDELGGELLILGAPGTGKTTMLLELARDLIARARINENYYIPAVFNLSTYNPFTWIIRIQSSLQRQPLKGWLVEELCVRYLVPYKLAEEWINADVILPLLDGLDEVAAHYREKCVETINTYRQERGFTPLAICSRDIDYKALTATLQLHGAILIQPLTKQRVAMYLEKGGQSFAGLHTALSDDLMLWELIDTPLMLSIAALTYKYISPTRPRMPVTLGERRRRLFDDYIAAMFARLGRSEGKAIYMQRRIIHWLSLLAEWMVRHNQIVFYIERMQADLLTQREQRELVLRVHLLIGLVGGLAGGLIGGVFGGLIGNIIDGRIGWLVGGLVGGALGGRIGWLLNSVSDAVEIRPDRDIPRSAKSWLVFGLGVTLVLGLGIALVFGLHGGRVGIGLLIGLLIGLGIGLLGELVYDGFTVLQHYALRYLLYRKGSLPLRLIPFLDYCAERIFLRKVGGGYIFVHRLLMEHFADLHRE